MSIGHALDALLAALTHTEAPLTKWLASGMSRAEIGARVESLPLRLADEVYDYFAWRDGLRPTRDADYELFPGFTVLSLEEARSTTLTGLGMARGSGRRVSQR